MAKFSDILAKAEKRAVKQPKPYVLELEEGTFEIEYPDALQYLEFSELEDDQMLKQLQVIFRKSPRAWNALVRELSGQPASTLQVLVEDMFSFWDAADKTPGKSAK